VSSSSEQAHDAPSWRPTRPKLRPLHLLVAWVVAAAALLIAAWIVPGASINGFPAALAAAAVIAALNAVVPPVLEPLSLAELLESVTSVGASALMCVEPSAAAAAIPLSSLDMVPSDVSLFIGPEGGWTPAEIEQAVRCHLVTLGGRTLRAAVAPVVAMAALFAIWKEY